jgi:hypothetical protein
MAANKTTKTYTDYIMVYGVMNDGRPCTQVWVTSDHIDLNEELKDYVYIGRPTLSSVDEFVNREWMKDRSVDA